MRDDTQTPDPSAIKPPVTDEAATRIATLESLLSEQATKFSEQVTLASALTAERDALAVRAALVDSLSAERDKALLEFKQLTDATREDALMSRLYAALPHAPRTDVARTLKALAAEGKVVLASETPDRTAAGVLEMLKSEQSALLRTPVGASGSTNPVVQATAQVDPMLALFGPRRKS